MGRGPRQTKFEDTAESISLHGLGFLQVKLDAWQRLHVWHPDLPRRACAEYSQIHDHRFGFSSLVLKGVQINNVFTTYETEKLHAYPGTLPPHMTYLHEGERGPSGNRPWISRGLLGVIAVSSQAVPAGGIYHMLSRVFHSTTPAGDGRVATLMTKTVEGRTGARSLCAQGTEPDTEFDRKQMTEDDMWAIIRDVLNG